MVWFHPHGQSIISDITLEYLLSLTFRVESIQKHHIYRTYHKLAEVLNISILKYSTKYEMKQRPRKITHSVINPKVICSYTRFSKQNFN